MKWNEMEGNEIKWNEMKGNEIEWAGMNWNGWIEIKSDEVKWNEIKWNEIKWNEVKCNNTILLLVMSVSMSSGIPSTYVHLCANEEGWLHSATWRNCGPAGTQGSIWYTRPGKNGWSICGEAGSPSLGVAKDDTQAGWPSLDCGRNFWNCGRKLWKEIAIVIVIVIVIVIALRLSLSLQLSLSLWDLLTNSAIS